MSSKNCTKEVNSERERLKTIHRSFFCSLSKNDAGKSLICLAMLGSAAEWILAAVDSISKSLDHDLEGGILGQLDHEHAGLHSDEASVRCACRPQHNTTRHESALTFDFAVGEVFSCFFCRFDAEWKL